MLFHFAEKQKCKILKGGISIFRGRVYFLQHIQYIGGLDYIGYIFLSLH